MDKPNYAEFQKARKSEESKITNLSEFSTYFCPKLCSNFITFKLFFQLYDMTYYSVSF